MHKTALSAAAFFSFLIPASAQEDSPVWESYLARIAAYHPDRLSTSVEFVWEKGGGPHEHKEHQVYLLAYLQKDEKDILELMKDPRLTTKAEVQKPDGTKDDDKILDVLLARKLVIVLETTVATRTDRVANAADPKTAGTGREFPFTCKFENALLFERVRALPGFDAKAPVRVRSVDSYQDWFQEDFKLMPFIPVNDCKYADKVKPENKTDYDFTYGEYRTDGNIAQYMRPLPYVFTLTQLSSGEVLVYIH